MRVNRVSFEHYYEPAWQFVSEEYHARCGYEGSYEYLSLTSDVPEPHLVCRRYGYGNAEHYRHVLHHDPELSRSSERSLEYRGIHVYRVKTRYQSGDDCVDYQGQEYGYEPYLPDLIPFEHPSCSDVEQWCVLIIHLPFLLRVSSS